MNMAFEVTFNLENDDLDYFRDVMRKAQTKAKNLSEHTILANARQLCIDVSGVVPNFVQTRLQKLEVMIAMVEDDEWGLPIEERADVLAALSYFSDSDDLVPDEIPVLGFLDDAIMIELVAESLTDSIDAYQNFCVFRSREFDRLGSEVTKQDWLANKRRELHERVRSRRSGQSANGGSFRSIF